MNKFILNEVGIGDIIIFFSFLSEFYKDEVIHYYFNIDTIKKYKTKDYEEYYNFIKIFSQYILNNTNHKNFIFNDIHSGNFISINHIRDIYSKNNIKFQYVSIDNNTPIFNDTIILLSKVRGCSYDKYKKIKTEFYDTINNGNKNIIILGEKQIEPNPEYVILTNQTVYSIYYDIIHNVNSNKITDLTIDKLGITSPSLEKLTYDIDIIKNHKVAAFGSSGIVSLCSLFTDVLSYANLEPLNTFLDSDNRELKYNSEDFINILNQIVK
jgi:hypothetical protein